MKGSLKEGIQWLLEANKGKAGYTDKVCTYTLSIGAEGTSLVGIVNRDTKELVTDPCFTHVGKFVQEVAPCVLDDRAGYVRTDGTYLLEPSDRYQEASEITRGFGTLKVRNGGWKLYSLADRKFVNEEEFDKIEEIGLNWYNAKSMPLFKVYKGSAIGLIRGDGVWLISLKENTIEFIAPNLVVTDKLVTTNNEDAKCLFSLKSEKIVVNNAYNFKYIPKGTYLIYDTFDSGRVLAHITEEHRCHELAKGYQEYKWMNQELVACFLNETSFDILSLRYDKIMHRLLNECWSENKLKDRFLVQCGENLGIINADGSIALHIIAESVDVLTTDLVRVSTDSLTGLYDLKRRIWNVLPQFVDVLNAGIGIFRISRNVSYGRKNYKVWRYVYQSGKKLTMEEFLEAGRFENDGYARVKTREGIWYRLSLTGQLLEL